MTDREIILAIRTHCHDGIAERAKFRDPLSVFDGMYLVGYYLETMRAILAECDMRTCQCDRGPVDGSGVMRGECWARTSDGSRADE
jgi:hypothetical protein